MHTFSEVRQRSRRANYSANSQLHFFSSRVSIYFTYIFVNLGLSANAVTGIFFLVGLIGPLCLFFLDPIYAPIFYITWRLHIIFDICDGEVARFFQKFSLNGVYWDYMIHALLYPLYGIAICFHQYKVTSDPKFLYLALAMGITGNLLNAVKNNYSRALFEKNIPKGETEMRKKKTGLKHLVFTSASALLGFEGFLLVYLINILFLNSEMISFSILLFYIVSHSLIISAKFLSLSMKGQYQARS